VGGPDFVAPRIAFKMVDMTRPEKRWCAAAGVILIFLTTLPYLVGCQAQTPEMRFSGFVIGVEDGNSYIAKMLSGASGEWLFRSPYSAEPQQGVIAFLPYILLGKLAAGDGLHAQLIGLFHLARWGGILALVFSLYSFVSIFIESVWWRRWVVILSLVGSGMGWVLFLVGQSDWLGSMPLGVYSPETFGFLAVLTFPHLIWARALLLIGLTSYLGSQDQPNRAWISGLCFAVLVLVQPLSVLAGYAAIAGHQLYLLFRQWRLNSKIIWSDWMTSGLRVLLLSSPLVIYLLLAFSADPYLEAWTAQNRILSPHPVHYLLAYGLVAVFSIYGVYLIIKLGKIQAGLIAVWVLLFPLRAYIPHNLQRRFPEGIWVALLITAAIGLRQIRTNSQKYALALLLLILPTSVIVWAGAMESASSPASPIFIPADEVAGFQWLQYNAQSNSVVLAPYRVGNALPAWAPVHVVIGHGPESVGLERLQPLAEAFFLGNYSDSVESMLIDYSVDYIWYGAGNEPTLEVNDQLELSLEFVQGGVRIFSIDR
jgi:hypothetical protein